MFASEDSVLSAIAAAYLPPSTVRTARACWWIVDQSGRRASSCPVVRMPAMTLSAWCVVQGSQASLAARRRDLDNLLGVRVGSDSDAELLPVGFGTQPPRIAWWMRAAGCSGSTMDVALAR